MILQRIPPGHYELWPDRDDEEGRAMIAASGPRKSARLARRHPGTNRVTLRFRRGAAAASP